MNDTTEAKKNEPLRTLYWRSDDLIEVIDQRLLPHELRLLPLRSCQEVVEAIRDMVVRGAPLIGATAAYGVYFAVREAAVEQDSERALRERLASLRASRPTAVNLFWAIDRQLAVIDAQSDWSAKAAAALAEAQAIVEDDIAHCASIGRHGLPLLSAAARRSTEVLNILTHCNAGMLGCIRWGTATSPIYQAHAAGVPVHVWVDETRPRNQGANLTAWELSQHGVPHTVITDNAGGYLMQSGQVDMVIVGTDRVTRCGDVANKIGTYLKALAAKAHDLPFYVALPSSTIDWQAEDGLRDIAIEMRGEDEVKYVWGQSSDGKRERVLITPASSAAANHGFDITPAALVSGFITERGVCDANEQSLRALFAR